MKYFLTILILLCALCPAHALYYGQYKNDSCGIFDALKFKRPTKIDKGIVKIKDECAEMTDERRLKELEMDKGYNEYEAYKRMLYYDTVAY